MITTDPIADMLTRIRNGLMGQKAEVAIPYSKIKFSIAEILQKTGYLTKVAVVEQNGMKNLSLSLEGSPSKPESLERISKPGRRIYAKKTAIPRVRNGQGIVIISTPAGIMTGDEAKAKGLGGELICEVY